MKGRLIEESRMIRGPYESPATFGDFVKEFAPIVENHVHRIVGMWGIPSDLEEDLRQDFFLKMGVKFGKSGWYDGKRRKAKFTSWVITVLFNFLVDSARQRYRRLRLFADHVVWPRNGESFSLLDIAPASSNSSLADFLDETKKDIDPFSFDWNVIFSTEPIIAKAFNELPQDMKVVIVLHYVLGKEMGEIADELEIAEGTVKSRTFRGIIKVQQKLIAHGIEIPIFARKTIKRQSRIVGSSRSRKRMAEPIKT